MTIDALTAMPTALPAVTTSVDQQLPTTTGVGAPTDPFAVLLDAASQPSSAGTLGALATGSTSPYGELAGLAQMPNAGGEVVADAEHYLGVPYVWGGTSPSEGFDCSGFVQHVYGDLGITLPRTSQQQSLVGTPVDSLADAQPGDLLFFEPGANGPGHVAIYFGDGEMIDAPQTGESVQIQQVPTDAIVGIRRVLDPSATNSGTTMGSVLVPGSDAGLVATSASAAGMPASLLAAVLSTESGFNPAAVSSAGAEGVAQFMPQTAAGIGINPFDQSQAIPAAAQLLASYHDQFGSWPLALAAYNAGPAQASSSLASDPGVQSYVSTVLGRASAPSLLS